MPDVWDEPDDADSVMQRMLSAVRRQTERLARGTRVPNVADQAPNVGYRIAAYVDSAQILWDCPVCLVPNTYPRAAWVENYGAPKLQCEDCHRIFEHDCNLVYEEVPNSRMALLFMEDE